jgi:hypothetical protein
VNLFVAAVQTGFGAFVTVYLVKNQWPPQAIGFALTIATMSSLLSQLPAGAVLDGIRDLGNHAHHLRGRHLACTLDEKSPRPGHGRGLPTLGQSALARSCHFDS